MDIGNLRHRVTIQSKTESQDAYGEATYTWATVVTVWAAVEPLTAREFISGRAELQEVTTRIRMRSRDDVTPEMRCTWNGHTYDIESVIRIEERDIEMELLCTEAI